jgi:hypothetical protein
MVQSLELLALHIPPATASWTVKTIYTFKGGSDGPMGSRSTEQTKLRFKWRWHGL